jgi:hypothetical protein
MMARMRKNAFSMAPIVVGGVTFNYSLISRGWEFKYVADGVKNTYIAHCRGGTKARAVAGVINGGLKRKGMLDGLARAGLIRLGV